MISFPILTTKHCLLNGMSNLDVGEISVIFNEKHFKKNLPELKEFSEDHRSLSQFITSFRNLQKVNEGCLWCIRKDNRLAGFIAVMDLSFNPTIFYAMHPNYRFKGYMTECVSTVIDYLAKTNSCKFLQTEVHKTNKISIRVLLSNGFIIVRCDNHKLFLKKGF